jgi:phosphohistidine phosphatase SixA
VSTVRQVGNLLHEWRQRRHLSQPRFGVFWLSAMGYGLLAAAVCLTASVVIAADGNRANHTGPRLILIIRHAEKPDDRNDPDLTAAGRRRAENLADYLPRKFGIPDFLFASTRSKHSNRPIETVEPLSKKIGVPISDIFADEDFAALAHKLLTDKKYDQKFILICWHHGRIPDLAFALGASRDAVPNPWDPTVFNLILELEYEGSAPPATAKITEPF